MKRKIIFQVPSHRCYVSGREGTQNGTRVNGNMDYHLRSRFRWLNFDPWPIPGCLFVRGLKDDPKAMRNMGCCFFPRPCFFVGPIGDQTSASGSPVGFVWFSPYRCRVGNLGNHKARPLRNCPQTIFRPNGLLCLW